MLRMENKLLLNKTINLDNTRSLTPNKKLLVHNIEPPNTQQRANLHKLETETGREEPQIPPEKNKRIRGREHPVPEAITIEIRGTLTATIITFFNEMPAAGSRESEIDCE